MIRENGQPPPIVRQADRFFRIQLSDCHGYGTISSSGVLSR